MIKISEISLASLYSTKASLSHTHAGTDIIGTVANATNVPFSGITDVPTTLSGYRITDAASLIHTHTKTGITDFAHTHIGTDIIGAIANASYANSAGACTGNATTASYATISGNCTGNAATVGGYAPTAFIQPAVGFANYINSTLNSSKSNYMGNWTGSGQWGIGSPSGHVLKFDQTDNSGNFVGATDITLKLGTKTVVTADQIPTSLPANGGTSSACSGNSVTSNWTSRLNANTHAMGTYNVQPDWTGSYWRLRGYNGDSYHAGCQVAYADYAGSAGNADTVDGYHISDIQSIVSNAFDAGHSFATNGYQKLNNGFIIQWGYLYQSSYGGNPQTNSFPISFPNACMSLVTTQQASGEVDWTVVVDSVTTATFISRTGNAADYFRYIAIGY